MMTPKFRVFMNDASSQNGAGTAWHEIHGVKDGDNFEYTKENVLIKPRLDLEVNNAGKFEFTIPIGHNQYDWPKVDATMVEVYELAPNIDIEQTIICDIIDDFNTVRPVDISAGTVKPGWITIYVHYSALTFDALAQSFTIKKFLGGTEVDSITVNCTDPKGTYYKYAMQTTAGQTNSFTIQSVGKATVPVQIKMYTEVSTYTPTYKSVFYGRVSQIDVDFYKNKVVSCEGALAFLNDVIIRDEDGDDEGKSDGRTCSLSAFLKDYFFPLYNAGGGTRIVSVDPVVKRTGATRPIADRLQMGMATTQSGADIQPGDGDRTGAKEIYRRISYENAFEVFTKKIVGAEGGYFLMRRSDINISQPSTKSGFSITRWKYILPKTNDPYPADETTNEFQAVAEYKLNLTDLKHTWAIDDIVTTVVPIGHYNSDDVTIYNAEYIETGIDLYSVNTQGSEPVYSKIDLSGWYIPATLDNTCYFAFYDMIGGCRMWTKVINNNITLYTYNSYADFKLDKDATSVAHKNLELTRTTGDAYPDVPALVGKGRPIDISTFVTAKGWNYFAIKSNAEGAGTSQFKVGRIDRDANVGNAYLLDYIEDPALVAKYGNKSKVVDFNDLAGGSRPEVRKSLIKAGADWLRKQIYIPETLEVNAVDMTYLDPKGESGAYPFMLGQSVRVLAANHGVVEKLMTITKLEIDLDSAKMMVTLGTPQIPTLTEYYKSKKKGEYTKEYTINDNT